MRKILHVDLDAFFCSVEELFDPTLKNKPFATGGTAEGRGVVTSCSYAARHFGIRSAMPMAKALRLCPNLITVRGHYRQYSDFSKRTMEILKNLTPLVEPISIDEAFLDVSDLPQNSKNIAINIQSKIKREVGLPSSIGAASNKLIAKIATNIGKSKHKQPTAPMAINIVPDGGEKEFLRPLPIREMWGIGPKSEILLRESGIKTIGDIQSMQISRLEQIFGNFARSLMNRAFGIDDRPVGEHEGVKSVSNERTFFNLLKTQSEVYKVARDLSAMVGRRLRRSGLSGKTVRLKLRWPDFVTITRQVTLDQPTNHDSVIFSSIKKLLNENWVVGKGVRLLGVAVSNLESDIFQLSLFDKDFQKERMLLEVIDNLQERYGKDVIQKGSSRK